MKKTKQNLKKLISTGSSTLKLIKSEISTSINNFNLARAMPFLIILLLSVAMVSAGDVVAKAGDLEIDGNMTLGEKITFNLGEIIDNIIDGWVTITGNLNVTNNVTVDGGIQIYQTESTEGLYINQTGSDEALKIYTTATESGINLIRNNAAPTDKLLMVREVDSNANQNVVSIENYGTGKALYIQNTGGGMGIVVDGGDVNITGGLNLSSYPSCTALETDASGNVLCGSDDAGSGMDYTNLAMINKSNTFGAYNQTFDTNTLHVDSTNNRVGIGTTSPAQLFTVWEGNAEVARQNGNGDIIFKLRSNGAHARRLILDDATNKFGISRSDSLGSDFVIDATGKVGIGTASPSAPLQVSSSANPIIRSTDTTNNLNVDLRAQNTFGQVGTQTNHNLHIMTNNADKIIIDTAGNVGIGTTSPTHTLHVDGDVNVTGKSLFEDKVRMGGYYSAIGGYQLRVYSGSNVAIGGVSGDTIGIWGYSEDNIGVQGRGESGSYDFYADGPGTDYGTSSSLRWKDNIKEIDSSLDKIRNIRGVSFDWKEGKYPGLSSEEKHDIGFISEEIVEVIPEIVGYGEEDGEVFPNGIDYGAITPILVEAIKELDSENSLLKTELCKKDSSYAFC